MNHLQMRKLVLKYVETHDDWSAAVKELRALRVKTQRLETELRKTEQAIKRALYGEQR